ncbi:glycosyltransferase family 4 protein [Aliarcobacter butzleri]|uniref:glycosyltransferase family 4 protein n=1 Tax=Aliarcobacter butzleri TaxID=28197 RepID=UPI00263E8F58|nr:glycosyltransferase family 4 protein [Aliarcobacter butzleri]MDN5102200.1 glycosyltransferase family 4 protein [Aliarcobacter butzleri]
MKNKIIYIHPAIRTYRVGIFERLSEKLNIRFFWSGVSKPGTHISEEINRILKSTHIDYTQAKELHSIPIDNFSLDLLKLPFQGYKVFIFSNITGVPYLLLTPLLKLMGKKIILFDELWRYPKEINKYKKIYPYVKFLIKYCLDGVVAAGSKAKEFYIDEFGFDKEKIVIAYNTTIDTKDYVNDENLNNSIKQKLQNTTSKKKLLYLGRIVKYKGLDVLIKAMANINTEYDLIVVGDGEFKKECLILVNELNLNTRVHFLGSCLSNEAPYYYKNSDIFVLPTRFRLDANVQMESWGFTVNEAMALEVSVVTTTAVGSGFDLIIDGVTGGLAVAGDEKSLSEKINFIIENNNDNKIGEEARKHLLKTCNYDDNLKAYENIIKKVLDE